MPGFVFLSSQWLTNDADSLSGLLGDSEASWNEFRIIGPQRVWLRTGLNSRPRAHQVPKARKVPRATKYLLGKATLKTCP